MLTVKIQGPENTKIFDTSGVEIVRKDRNESEFKHIVGDDKEYELAYAMIITEEDDEPIAIYVGESAYVTDSSGNTVEVIREARQ